MSEKEPELKRKMREALEEAYRRGYAAGRIKNDPIEQDGWKMYVTESRCVTCHEKIPAGARHKTETAPMDFGKDYMLCRTKHSNGEEFAKKVPKSTYQVGFHSDIHKFEQVMRKNEEMIRKISQLERF